MSAQTAADNAIYKAKESINDAYKCLLEALDPDTYGSDEYANEYIDTMEAALVTLRQLKRKL